MNDSELGDLLVQLHDRVDRSHLDAPPGTTGRVEQRARHLARRRRMLVTSTTASAIVAAALVAVVAISDGDRRVITTTNDANTSLVPSETPVTVETTAAAVQTSVPATQVTVPDTTVPLDLVPLQPAGTDWQTVPGAPLAARAAEAVVVVDDQVVVWGGTGPNSQDGSEPQFSDGAVLDLATKTWRPMSASPLAAGATTGAAIDDVAVLVDSTGAIASYDPAIDRWSPFEGPGTPLDQLIAWDGVLVGVSRGRFHFLDRGWHQMPDTEVTLHRPQLVAVGDHLMVFGEDPASAMTSPRHGMGYRLDSRDDRWRPLPASPLTDYYADMAGAGAVDGRLVVVDWAMEAAAYDPATDTWERLPDLPGFTYKCLPEVVGIGSTVVTNGCGFVGVLGAGQPFWTISSPAGTRTNLGLHATRTSLIAGQAVLTGDPTGVLLSPIAVGAVTIDPAASPAGFRGTGSASSSNQAVTVDLLASQCVLTATRGELDPQVTMASAYAAASTEPAPPMITWGSLVGTYQLQCSDTAEYASALPMLRTEGERTASEDATDEVVALAVAPTASAEGLIDAIAPLLAAQFDGGEGPPAIGLTWNPKDGPSIATIELYGFADDSVSGVAYTIVGHSTDDGWVVDSATKAFICSRGSTGEFCV